MISCTFCPQEHAITSDEALALEDLPENKTVVTVGAGYISLEFAHIFHGFGCDTHVMIRKKAPLRGCGLRQGRNGRTAQISPCMRVGMPSRQPFFAYFWCYFGLCRGCEAFEQCLRAFSDQRICIGDMSSSLEYWQRLTAICV